MHVSCAQKKRPPSQEPARVPDEATPGPQGNKRAATDAAQQGAGPSTEKRPRKIAPCAIESPAATGAPAGAAPGLT